MTARNNPPIEFADRMRIARTARGLFQNELATRLGRSMQTVSRWETGETAPQRQSDIEMLAEVLDVDTEWLDPDGIARSRCSDFVAA